jgi:hypothetical protein
MNKRRSPKFETPQNEPLPHSKQTVALSSIALSVKYGAPSRRFNAWVCKGFAEFVFLQLRWLTDSRIRESVCGGTLDISSISLKD